MSKRFAFAMLGLLAWSTIQVQASPKIDPALDEFIKSSTPRTIVQVAMILKSQIDFQATYERVKGLPPRERRQIVITELKSLAGHDQALLLRDLDKLEKAGRLSRIKSLWISNAVVVNIEVRTLGSLLECHPEIDRVNWDISQSDMPPQIKSRAIVNPDNVDEISWGVADLRVPEVWDCGFRGAGVTIAHLDVGVDYNHPDLADRIWINSGEDVNGNGLVDSSDWNGVDDDHNGYVDDLRGWSFYDDSSEVMDMDGNGTITAGIICGNGSGGTQTGVAPEAKLMILKDYGGVESDFWEAQQYAMDMGADLICSSLSFKWWYQPRPDYATLRHNTDMELAAGMIHVNTVGGESGFLNIEPIPLNIPAPANSPPPWLHPDQTLIGGVSACLGIGSYDLNHQLKALSSMGPASWLYADIQALDPTYPWSWQPEYNDYPYQNGQSQGLLKPDFCAPADVITTARGGGYTQVTDNYSTAGAHIGGAVSLLLDAAPFSTPETLSEVLMTSCIDMGAPGKDNLWGCGRPDLFAALSELLAANYGGLTGTVTDINTGNPVAGATVAIPELARSTQCDSLGHYLLSLIAPGLHDVCFSAAGHDTLWAPDFFFSAGVIDTLSVYLPGPRIWLGISSITVALTQGEIQQTAIPIRNTGTADLTVSFSKKGDWTPFQTFSTIPAENLCGDDQLYGVEVAGESIWISGGNSGLEPNKLYRCSFDGNLLETLDQPPSPSPLGWRDLAWDGQYLYGSAGTQIVGIDTTGSVQTTINGPLQYHRALAYNPDDDCFISCDDTTNIVEFNRSGAVTRTWGHSLHVQGLAWHPNDEDSCSIYIFSTDGAPGNLRVSKLNPAIGIVQFVADVTGVAGEIAAGATISGALDPDRWCFVCLVQGSSDRVESHSLNAYAPYLTVTPHTQVIAPGVTFNATAILDAGAVAAGDYEINLVIEHNTPQADVVIPVSLTVEPVGVINEPEPLLPMAFRIGSAYPNPFNATTVIPLELPQRSQVKIELYNLCGQKVAIVFDGVKSAGVAKFNYQATNLASGVYFYKVQATGLERGGTYSEVRKMLLLK
ncbi:MAG: S8 family serine peptidase [bacterium]|nr:S8 family serine peptidase [bacterium]